MKVYVVIVSFNGRKWIDTCLQSLRLSSVKLHTIVVDNQSTDDTVSHVLTNYPEVQLIQSERNLGFGQANNIGLKTALSMNSDYVLLLNQDAWIEPSMIERLINISLESPYYWILTPLQCNSRSQTVEAYFQKYLIQNRIRLSNVKTVVEMQFANAALWLIPRKTIEIVGGFDPLFPHYGEDNDYINRMHYWGGKIGLVPTAIGYHDRDIDNTLSFEKKQYKTTLGIVGQLKDINKSLFINLLNSKCRLLKKTINYLFQLDWIELRVYWRAFFNSIKQLSKITKQRALSKEKGAFLESRQ